MMDESRRPEAAVLQRRVNLGVAPILRGPPFMREAPMQEALQLAIRAGHPIIAIEHPDESRALELVRQVAAQVPRPLYEWSITSGLIPADKTHAEQIVAEGKPAAALQHVVGAVEPAIYLFKDLGPH